MFRLHSSLLRRLVIGRPVVRSVHPLVSFTLLAGGGGMVIAGTMSALSA